VAHACCPNCRLRVISVSQADALLCPGCSHPMVRTAAAESIGYPLVNAQRLPSAAAAAALPVPPGLRS
jgi:hypothetical protein